MALYVYRTDNDCNMPGSSCSVDAPSGSRLRPVYL